jgi:signal transduction protein with GAF and PtsI domain
MVSLLLFLSRGNFRQKECPAHNTENEQKNFRKVLRSMLYDVQDMNQRFGSGQKARRRELLSLYRWTPGSNGLAY